MVHVSQPVPDLIGPEAFEPDQRLVKPCELLGSDTAALLDRGDMFVIEGRDDVMNVTALVGQPDSHGAAVNPRARMMQIAGFDQFLDIVRDVRTEVIAARAQFASGQLLVGDIIQQQGLNGVDIAAAAPVEFVFDHVEKTAAQRELGLRDRSAEPRQTGQREPARPRFSWLPS